MRGHTPRIRLLPRTIGLPGSAGARIVFISPPSEVIKRMGDKPRRETMRQAGVPVIPGSDTLRDIATARHEAENRFSAAHQSPSGRGGRGIRLVREAGEFERHAASVAERGTPLATARSTLKIPKAGKAMKCRYLPTTTAILCASAARLLGPAQKSEMIEKKARLPSPECQRRMAEASVMVAGPGTAAPALSVPL